MSHRREVLLGELRSLLGDLAGQTIEPGSVGHSWFDLGFDSLFLTQAATAVKSRFGVKVTFRQLLGDLGSMGQLAEHLDAQLPPEVEARAGSAEPASVSVVPSMPVVESDVLDGMAATLFDPGAGDGALTGTVLERVMREQARVMQMQLALLRESTPRVEQLAPAGAVKPKPAVVGGEAKPATEVSPESAAPVQHGPFRGIQKGEKGGLTARQQAHLEELTRRYVARTSKSKAYTVANRRHLADPRAVAGFNQNWKEMVYPIVSSRSKGARLWDLDGNEWVDVTMGFGVALLGHSPEFITEAVKEQLELGVEIGPQSPLAGEVAELICDFTGMERVTFCNTGSEAVMAALRICRTVTGRSKVALFGGAYHGTFDEVLVRGVRPGGGYKTLPLAPGVAPNLISAVTVLEYGTEESLEWIRQNVDDLAAVLVETVQSRHPDLQPKAFLEEVRAITAKAETPLIFDEVITGFRCHPGGAQGYFGIEADLATYGKIIGGGMPFGFIAGKAWLMDAFDGGQWQYGDDSYPEVGVTFFAGTFVRHPLAMAAAKAMLLHLKEHGEGLQAGLAKRTDRMLGELNAYFERHQVPLRLEHFTSVWYPHFGADVKYGSLLYYHLREKGLHIWEGRPCFLSTAHTAEDEAFIEAAFKRSVAEMQAGGFLGGTSDSEYRVSGVEGGGYSLAAAQREMWLGAQMRPEAAGPHHACTGLWLEGVLRVDLLERAIGEVRGRHEALSSRFSGDGERWLVEPEAPLRLEVEDLTGLGVEERDARVQTVLNEEGRRLMDLEKGPLTDWRLLRLEPERYLLVFTAQMIVCDGWAHYVVFEDLSEIYSALVEGREAKLRPAVSIPEFLRAQEEQVERGELDRCGAYWEGVFRLPPPPLDLPVKGLRPPTRTFEAARGEWMLDADLCKGIRALARSRGSSYFGVLLAAFEVWLYRLSGGRDLVVGVPFAAQGPLGLDRYVGQCANTLPLRVDLHPGEPFSALLARVWERVLDAQEHWNFTYGQLLSKVSLPKDASRIPLVSVLFNIDPPMSKVGFAGLGHRFFTGPRHWFQYDLGFNLVETDAGIRVECDYNTHLFDGEMIQSWVQGYDQLLRAVVRDAEQEVDVLPMTVEVNVERNEICDLASGGATVMEMVAGHARKSPDAVAVRSGDVVLTYGELEARAERVAVGLMREGLAAGGTVGIDLDSWADRAVACLAVLKAGCGYVLLPARDMGSPAVLHESHPAGGVVVGTEPHDLNRWAKYEYQQFSLPRLLKGESLGGGGGDSVAVAGGRAVVAWTSDQAGVRTRAWSHEELASGALEFGQAVGLSEGMHFIARSRAGSAEGLVAFWAVLGSGGCWVEATGAWSDPVLLDRALAVSGLATLMAPASTWKDLVRQGWAGGHDATIVSWGDKLSDRLAGELAKRGGRVFRAQELLENHGFALVSELRAGGALGLGRRLGGGEVAVCDRNLHPIPMGAIGRIYVRRCGEQGGWLPTHYRGRAKRGVGIELLGAMERCVQLRGCPVDLQQVEDTVAEDLAVADVVVRLEGGGGENPVLVAFVVFEKSDTGTVEERVSGLRRRLKAMMPDYMVPGRFAVLEQMPLGVDGAVQLGALPDSADVAVFGDEAVAPRTEHEARLAEIWREILQVKVVQATDSFFDLGGQSLTAVRLFARIEEVFGKKLPLATLFRAPTLEALAAELGDGGGKAETWGCLVPIQEKGERSPLFLVHGAGGNVLLYRALAERMAPDYPLYGLQSLGLDGETEPLKTIEEMAERYLEEVRRVQPHGPYFLGGYCLGGTVAYEMAQRLTAAGEQVALVALLDTYNFIEAQKAGFLSFILQKIRFHLANMLSLGPKALWRYLREKSRIAGDGEWANLKTAMPGSTLQEGVARAEGGAEASVQALNDHAADVYQPKPYGGELTLFKPQINYKFYPDPKMGWGKVAGGLNVVELAMNPHAMLMEPYVQQLAERLKSAISGAATQASVSNSRPTGPGKSREVALAGRS